MGLLSGASTTALPCLGRVEHGVNAGVAQTWPGVTEDLSENLMKAFSCFRPKVNPEWEALLFAWHYLHDAFGKAAVPFTLEKSITRLPQAPCAILCIARCSSYAHHGLSRLRSRTSKNPLGESTWFSFLPLTVDQRPNQGKEEWGDGSGVGTTGEEEEGKGITLNWCWKSSFHKCETIMCGIFKVQLSNPKVGLFFFK